MELLKKNVKKNEELNRYIAFSLGMEEYAIPLLKVKEVIALTEITPVPYTPTHFKGIMNLRGLVISVIDLREKFQINKLENNEETSIIILDLSPLCLGVIVDSINNVLSIAPSEIQPTPDIESKLSSEYITGVTQVDKKLLLLLDIEKTLSLDELSIMRKHHK